MAPAGTLSKKSPPTTSHATRDIGDHRTAAEYRELYAKAGFELELIIPTPSPPSIIIGRPQPG